MTDPSGKSCNQKMVSGLSKDEKRLLGALAWMCEQYLSDPGRTGASSEQGSLDHMFMGAGEGGIELLVEYGLVEPEPYGGTWTEAGRAFLESDR